MQPPHIGEPGGQLVLQSDQRLLRTFRAVISRATFEAAVMRPVLSRMGEIVSEMSSRRPCLVTRTVSKWSIRSPRRSRSRIAASSSCLSGGMMIVIGEPMTSFAA